MNRIIIIGAGGHGRVVEDASSLPCVFLDDNTALANVIGTPSRLNEFIKDEDGVVVAIGDNTTRLNLLQTIEQATVVLPPSAVVSKTASLGNGTVVFARAVVNPNAIVGIGCIINSGSTVEHDCVLANGVHISPGANLGGNVSIGECSWVGIGANVKNGVTIGKHVIIGAGAAVVNDIPDGVTVVGVPAKEIS
ncbi:MAG TPA: acetyltransferase [Phycisphaerales bacterium]|nr:acetyltransferase [Phycisphaerales bacterium]